MYNNFYQNPSFNNFQPYNSYNANFAQQNANAFSANIQAQTNITFVNGMEGAKAFQLRPNQNVLLMDSENQRFYVKSTDNLGIPNITSYDFTVSEFSKSSQESSQLSGDTGETNPDLLLPLIEKVNKIDADLASLQSKLEEVL